MSRIRFLWNFLKSPRQVGSVTPSSRWLCRRLLSAADLKACDCVVEFGPGTACLTREILGALPEGARLLAFEVNAEFAQLLAREITHPKFSVINESAEHVAEYLARTGFKGADYIFSGLPFTAMSARLRERILGAAFTALKPGGTFIAYQYSTYLLKCLRRIFGDVRVRLELRNIPPAFCFFCSKKNTD